MLSLLYQSNRSCFNSLDHQRIHQRAKDPLSVNVRSFALSEAKMNVLRQLCRRVPSQLWQFESAAAGGLLPQLQAITATQTAGLSTLVQQYAAQHHHRTAWQGADPLSSSSSSSSWATSRCSTFPMQAVRQYSQCDCPTLGGPSPDTVVVEYDDEEVDRFIALADAIEAAFPNVVVEGNPDGPGRPGSFEVKGQTGQLLFSRLSSGGWPEAEVLVDALAAEAACSTAAVGQKA